jgi:hypothetical protein
MQPTLEGSTNAPQLAPPHELDLDSSLPPPAKPSALRLDIARIVAIEDGALRNLLITQRYRDLSVGIAEVIGRENVNWSTFATWASKTAGESIRADIVPMYLRFVLDRELALQQGLDRLRARLFGPRVLKRPETLFDLARAAIARVQSQVAEGNLKVFAELAPMFADFAETFAELRAPDEARYAEFAARQAFRPGPPEANDGQDLLRSAFRLYYECAFERDAALKAQKVLLANCQIGLHEQTRLQPNIQGALDAPIREVVESKVVRSLPELLPQRVRGPLERAAKVVARPVVHVVTRIWERVATDTLMMLALPGGRVISLGQDVPDGIAGFPEPLRELTYPPLLALLERYDHTGNTLHGSGADDWGELLQRMNFIVDLFRVSQQDQTLYDQPFTAAQRDAFEAGRMPDRVR